MSRKFTITCYQQASIVGIKLIEYESLRIIELDNKAPNHLFDILVLAVIDFNHINEEFVSVVYYFEAHRWWQKIKKFLHFYLTLFSGLVLGHEVPNSLSNLLRNVHVYHSCIDLSNLYLVFFLGLVHSLKNTSQLTKYVGIDDGSHENSKRRQ